MKYSIENFRPEKILEGTIVTGITKELEEWYNAGLDDRENKNI
jgi:hypothetical protein